MTSTRGSLIWLLGLGAFGLAFSITTTAAYLPPLLAEFTDSQTVIAAVLAAEGLFALTVPLVIGPWSDTFLTPMGRRRPFMLAAILPMGFCLALVAFMPNLLTTAFVVMAFFFAYYVYEPPYRGLYPDLLHESVFARSQGVQHILRGIALGIALVGGGFLLSVWDPAPFLLAAVVTTVACGAVVRWVREDGGESRVYKGIRAYLGMSRDIFLHLPDVRMFLFAMACWEGTFAAMRTFVVLYVVEGLDQSLTVSSTILATVAAGYTVAAIVAGPIGDRVGAARVVFWSSVVYATGLLIAGFAQSWQSWYYAIIFPVVRRRRDGDDPLLGHPLPADAAGAARRHLGHRHDDEGLGAHLRPARGGPADRPLRATPRGHAGLPDPVALLRAARGRVDPDRRPRLEADEVPRRRDA